MPASGPPSSDPFAPDPATLPVHRISGPAELVQAVPYLLGFHPTHSLVLMGMRERRLIVTARLDLPDVAVPAALRHTISALVRAGATAVVAAVYPDPSLDSGAAIAAVAEHCAEAGIGLGLVVEVDGGRWREFGDDEPGSPVPSTASEFAMAATVAGRAPLADRATLAGLFIPLPDHRRAPLRPLVEAAEQAAGRSPLGPQRHRRAVVREIFTHARAAGRPRWPGVSEEIAARFGAALATTPVRDAVWMGIDDRRIDGRPLWLELARRLPAPWDAAPLFLYGWTAWRAGDGTSANLAVDRALESDPGYSAADLLQAALSHGVDPRRLPRLRLPRTA